jgi:hypothetical protein
MRRRAEPVTLVVLHELALRRIVRAAAQLRPLPDEGFGNAVPYFLDDDALARAAAGIESMTRPPQREPSSLGGVPSAGQGMGVHTPSLVAVG